MSNDRLMKYDIFTFIHPNTETGIIKPKKRKRENSFNEENYSLIFKFIEYDKKNCLPKIIKNWPEVQEDNNNLSRQIKKALGEWAEDKEKNNFYKENNTIGINLPGFDSDLNNNIENNNENGKKLFIDNNNKIKPFSLDDSDKNVYNINQRKQIELKEI